MSQIFLQTSRSVLNNWQLVHLVEETWHGRRASSILFVSAWTRQWSILLSTLLDRLGGAFPPLLVFVIFSKTSTKLSQISDPCDSVGRDLWSSASVLDVPAIFPPSAATPVGRWCEPATLHSLLVSGESLTIYGMSLDRLFVSPTTRWCSCLLSRDRSLSSTRPTCFLWYVHTLSQISILVL